MAKMASRAAFYGVAITVGVISVLLTACAAPTGVDRAGFIPAGGEPEVGVLDPRMGVTYTPVAEGWLKCAYRYDGVSVCWLVADTVSGGPR